MIVYSFISRFMQRCQWLIQFYYSPQLPYDRIRASVYWLDWFVPLTIVIVCIICTAMHLLPFAQQDQAVLVENNLQQEVNLTLEQKRQIIDRVGDLKTTNVVFVIGIIPINVFLTFFILAFVLKITNFIVFKSKLTSQQMFAIVSASFLVSIPALGLKTTLAHLTGTLLDYTALKTYLPQTMQYSFGGQIFGGINLFGFWAVWLLATGLSVVGQIKFKTTLITMVCLWGIWLVVKGVFETIITAFGLG